MKKYYEINIQVPSQEECEILIADLSEIGFYAFEQEEDILKAYIATPDFDDEKLKEVAGDRRILSHNIIEDQNWNKTWESTVQPVVVNHFAAIRPHFHPPAGNVKHDVIITPRMSFGTGHHATTYAMIELMEQVDFTGKAVLDFGTGTGVLAILAEKSNASYILAIDHDEWSISNAQDNVKINNCKNIVIEQRDNLSNIKKPFDIILANINLNVLTHASDLIAGLLKPGGLFLASGFLFRDVKEMQNIFEEKNVFIKQIKRSGDWVAILFYK